MPVDPVLAPLLPLPTMPPTIHWPTMRALASQQNALLTPLVAQAAPLGVTRRRVTVRVPGGSIRLVVHTPPMDGPLPLHLYLHGGGWISGSAGDASTSVIAGERAVGARCVVIAVDYRKAPEHIFPTALHDTRAALMYAVDHAVELGIRTDVITVGGSSAGANLAAALCIMLRDEGGPSIALQLLEVPALDLSCSLPSHSDAELGTAYALARVDVERMRRLYLGDAYAVRALDPLASPLLAEDLSGLPPAYLLSAELDLLRDDGPAYAARLRAAGVLAHADVREGHVHVSPTFTAVMPGAAAWRDDVVRVLRAANRGDPAAARATA